MPNNLRTSRVNRTTPCVSERNHPTILLATTAAITFAAERIKHGELVAFPTETIYGLGANALDDAACKKIYSLKGRPSDNPLIVHVSDEQMLKRVASSVPPTARKLMRRFWPGPLTIVLPKSGVIPHSVTQLQTVAVRMPKHKIARALIAAAGVPIAAPSANKSGSPSPTTAQHVASDFAESDLVILDGGQERATARHGLESTVVSVVGRPRVLRLGAITIEELRTVLPHITFVDRTGVDRAGRAGATHHQSRASSAIPESPGMKYRHYAPNKPLVLFGVQDLAGLLRYARTIAAPVILCKDQYATQCRGFSVIALGKTNADFARNLFAALRTNKGKTILVLGVSRRGIGRSIMDRLERAASGSALGKRTRSDSRNV